MTLSPATESVPYESALGHPQPRRKLLRTLLFRPRPIRRFAPRIDFDPSCDLPDPRSVAHWGEHVIIEDVATILHRDGTVTTLRHVVTQLHGAAQLAAWDESVRTFDVRCERHRIGMSRLLQPNGSWTPADVHVNSVRAPGPVDNAWGRMIVVRFAPLRPGVVVEFEEAYDAFRVHEFGPAFSDNFLLQTAPPCRRRRFTIAVARPFRLTHRLHYGANAPEERQIEDYQVSTWDVHDAAGVEGDEWTPPLRDFCPWVDVTTAENWTPFARHIRRELVTWSKVECDVEAIAGKLAQQKATPLAKAAAAYGYVASTVRYGRPPSELENRNSRTAAQTMRDLRGDCKDKSALLVQLLKSMDLQANLAMALTSDEGRTPFLPSARFNHVVVRLEHDGRTFWLDAAGSPFTFGEVPSGDKGVTALVLGGTLTISR